MVVLATIVEITNPARKNQKQALRGVLKLGPTILHKFDT